MRLYPSRSHQSSVKIHITFARATSGSRRGTRGSSSPQKGGLWTYILFTNILGQAQTEILDPLLPTAFTYICNSLLRPYQNVHYNLFSILIHFGFRNTQFPYVYTIIFTVGLSKNYTNLSIIFYMPKIQKLSIH